MHNCIAHVIFYNCMEESYNQEVTDSWTEKCIIFNMYLIYSALGQLAAQCLDSGEQPP